jgi:hypothetical protein
MGKSIDVDNEINAVNQEETTTQLPAASQSKTRAMIEQIILCVAIFFPLFLATLDTSIPLQFRFDR